MCKKLTGAKQNLASAMSSLSLRKVKDEEVNLKITHSCSGPVGTPIVWRLLHSFHGPPFIGLRRTLDENALKHRKERKKKIGGWEERGQEWREGQRWERNTEGMLSRRKIHVSNREEMGEAKHKFRQK